MAKRTKAATPTIVEAVGTASAQRSGLAGRIEAAMSAAAAQAQAEGERDPMKIRKRMLAARERVKTEDIPAR